MSDEHEDNGLRYETELGTHHASAEFDSANVTNEYEFEVETKTVFKRLAEDIYQSAEAGVREPLTNAVTAITRAVDEGYLDSMDEGVVLFELDESGSSRRLRIKDNGVGMTRAEIREVASVIGKSTARSEAEIAGQFGMGFLATWMLAGGADGGFVMRTNPRGSDDGPISGVWDSNSFSELDATLSSEMDPDDYGTEFDIILDESVNSSDVTRWISTYAEWARVSVLLRHVTESGLTDEEYPSKNITDKYEQMDNGASASEVNAWLPRTEDSEPDYRYYTIDTEFFTAVCSTLQGIDDKILLLDVPVSGGRRWSQPFPLNTIEIRFKKETATVVDGPNAGRFVVSQSEAQKRGSEYISQEDVGGSDIVMPSPTGTRDTLQRVDDFWEWLASRFNCRYYQDIAGILNRVDTIDQYLSLGSAERQQFHKTIAEIIQHYASQSLVAQLDTKADVTFGPVLNGALYPLHSDIQVSVAPEGRNGVSRQSNRREKSLRELVLKTYETNKEVFMADRVTQERAQFVWESETDHSVARVSTSKQQKYKKLFGWKNLTELDYESDLSMDDSTRRKFTHDATSMSEEQVKVHVGKYSHTSQKSVNELKKKLDSNIVFSGPSIGKTTVENIILFRRGGHNISDSRGMVGEGIATASVKAEIYEYLIDADGFLPAEQTVGQDVSINASDGNEYQINDLPQKVVPHIISEEFIDRFRDAEKMAEIQEWVRNNTRVPNDSVYLPITPFEKQIGGFENSSRNWNISTRANEHGDYRTISFKSSVRFYARTVLSGKHPATQAIETDSVEWDEGGSEIVELIEEAIE